MVAKKSSRVEAARSNYKDKEKSMLVEAKSGENDQSEVEGKKKSYSLLDAVKEQIEQRYDDSNSLKNSMGSQRHEIKVAPKIQVQRDDESRMTVKLPDDSKKTKQCPNKNPNHLSYDQAQGAGNGTK